MRRYRTVSPVSKGVVMALAGHDSRSHAERPMRADARRNYEQLVEQARLAFAESGVDASLDEIARRAGVASGTLYRHFPTRLDLIEAVLAGQIADLVGHRTTIVTQKVYRHQLKPVISTGATAMNTIFGNRKSAQLAR